MITNFKFYLQTKVIHFKSILCGDFLNLHLYSQEKSMRDQLFLEFLSYTSFYSHFFFFWLETSF